ncbi:hypothetical protein Acr_00g0054440 [Actinidia rufa]|uniref:Uncharacterized protein n=1 Tax=Actinidia rufa TaxID=165716 RepID=A0A7J0DLN1_9ERIC|nr:hypothetical protein Acr_00g0054440 [Actinidia rufa]
MDTSNTVRWRKHLWLVFFGLFVFGTYCFMFMTGPLQDLTPLAQQDHVNSVGNPNEMNDLSPIGDQSISSARNDQIIAIEKERSIEKIHRIPVGGKELESAKEREKMNVDRTPVGDREMESDKEREKVDID